MNFDETGAYRDLLELARRPYDLTRPGALTAGRIGSFKASAAGFDLLYSTQRVDHKVLAALAALADESGATEQFRRLLNGEVMNRIEGFESEERQVLHFACRDIFDDLPAPFDTAGSRQAVAAAKGELAALGDFLERVEGGALQNARGEPFTELINIGIGGSDLGPRALYQALGSHGRGGRRVHFISNLDPDDAARVMGGLELSRSLVNVVSKSGATTETIANEALARRAFTEAGLEPGRHFLCVTGEGSPLDDHSRYLAIFHLYDYIGGRYSATSMAGGVPLGFALGHGNFIELLRGAREMDLAAMEGDPRSNLPLLAALLGIWNRNFLGLPTLAVLPYSQGLLRFTAHLQQLDMESNGKSVTRQGRPAGWATGPIVWGEPGTNGQHAFFQLIHQSRTVVPCEFIGFRESQEGRDMQMGGTTSQQKLLANMLAQSIALATGRSSDNPNRDFPGNRPNSLLIGQRLTPHAMGALLAFYENKVAYQGLIWNINSFDQEGVQLGKGLAGKMMGHFKTGEGGQGTQAAGENDTMERAMLKAAGVL